VDVAVNFLTQLDLRRRQVAVNVKVIDINLSGVNNSSSSFSFGINNNFFVNDQGAASLNFGGLQPANTNDVNVSRSTPPIVPNQVTGDVFYDANGRVTVPLTGQGVNGPAKGVFLQPTAPVSNSPTRV
ncbi:hypothetical protein WME70_34010, partial [Microcoleus anatoxicus PTRS1]